MVSPGLTYRIFNKSGALIQTPIPSSRALIMRTPTKRTPQVIETAIYVTSSRATLNPGQRLLGFLSTEVTSPRDSGIKPPSVRVYVAGSPAWTDPRSPATYIYIYVYTHIHMRAYIHTCIHTYVHTYIHTYIHTYTYIVLYTCMNVYFDIHSHSLYCIAYTQRAYYIHTCYARTDTHTHILSDTWKSED